MMTEEEVKELLARLKNEKSELEGIKNLPIIRLACVEGGIKVLEEVLEISLTPEQKLGRILYRLYCAKKYEILVLHFLSEIPEGNYVSIGYICKFLSAGAVIMNDFRASYFSRYANAPIINAVMRMVRKGLLERHTLLPKGFKADKLQGPKGKRIRRFIETSVTGSISFSGHGKSKSVYRLAKKGRKKWDIYSQKYSQK